MTVIAWDGKTMAADRAWETNQAHVKMMSKIQKCGDWVVGCSGEATSVLAFLEWFKSKKPKTDDYPLDRNIDGDHGETYDFGVLCVNTKTLEIREYTNLSHLYIPIDNASYYAIGTGHAVALGVLSLGFDAVRAVEVCNEICPGCGCGVDSVNIVK